MKNFLITAIAIFGFCSINAQSNLKGMMHANAMVGYFTGSSTSKDDSGVGAIDSKSKVTGSNFGAQFQYALEDSFSVGIGLESNTFKLKVKDITNNVNDPSITTIKVSLSGRYYLLNKDKVNIFIGPTVGYASGKDKSITTNTPNSFFEKKYSGLNYGLNAGVNYYFTDSLGFIMQLTYEANSLTSTKSVSGNEDISGKTTISGLNIMGGLAFKF